MTYTKGKMDRGELADKFMVLITVDTLEEAQKIAEIYPDSMCSVHQVFASSYDIDYAQHKITFSPCYPEKETGQPILDNERFNSLESGILEQIYGDTVGVWDFFTRVSDAGFKLVRRY